MSIHGANQIMTPNIDMIGHQGIVIENYYTDAHGTPSRSAMFTGKYPFRMGNYILYSSAFASTCVKEVADKEKPHK